MDALRKQLELKINAQIATALAIDSEVKCAPMAQTSTLSIKQGSVAYQARDYEEVDCDSQLLPSWLSGCENFAEVIRDNAELIFNSLDSREIASLVELLPPGFKSDEQLLRLLRDELPTQFGQTPLQAFGAKLAQRHFERDVRHLRHLEDALALIEYRERIQS